MPMGMRRQLTFFADAVAGGAYPKSGDAGGFIFAKDSGGDENFQIYLHKDATGGTILLSDPSLRNTSPVWSVTRLVLPCRSSCE